MKTPKIKAELLCYAKYANFIPKKGGHFELVQGKKCLKGTMHFCQTYLEAVTLMGLIKGVAIYHDTIENDFIVCTTKEFKP